MTIRRILVFSEKDIYGLDCVSKAFLLGTPDIEVDAAVLGPNSLARSARYLDRGVAKAYVSDNAYLAFFNSKVCAQAIAEIFRRDEPDLVLIPSTKRGRDIAARLAIIVNGVSLANVLDIGFEENRTVTQRYGLGGMTRIAETIDAPRRVIALLPQRVPSGATRGAGKVVEVELSLDPPDLSVLRHEEKALESVDIENSRVLVCIGRGLKRKEDLELVRTFAKAVKGEIGCTKELASNLGWFSEERIVGMSGKRCKPTVCFSVGVSGQSQHIAGIAGAKTIVAINIDAAAPIFKVADYGIVGDLYVILPKLITRIAQRGKV